MPVIQGSAAVVTMATDRPGSCNDDDEVLEVEVEEDEPPADLVDCFCFLAAVAAATPVGEVAATAEEEGEDDSG